MATARSITTACKSAKGRSLNGLSLRLSVFSGLLSMITPSAALTKPYQNRVLIYIPTDVCLSPREGPSGQGSGESMTVQTLVGVMKRVGNFDPSRFPTSFSQRLIL